MKNSAITRVVYSGVFIMLLVILNAITFEKYLSYIKSFSILLIINVWGLIY